jgi:hypothetical protein
VWKFRLYDHRYPLHDAIGHSAASRIGSAAVAQFSDMTALDYDSSARTGSSFCVMCQPVLPRHITNDRGNEASGLGVGDIRHLHNPCRGVIIQGRRAAVAGGLTGNAVRAPDFRCIAIGGTP